MVNPGRSPTYGCLPVHPLVIFGPTSLDDLYCRAENDTVEFPSCQRVWRDSFGSLQLPPPGGLCSARPFGDWGVLNLGTRTKRDPQGFSTCFDAFGGPSYGCCELCVAMARAWDRLKRRIIKRCDVTPAQGNQPVFYGKHIFLQQFSCEKCLPKHA